MGKQKMKRNAVRTALLLAAIGAALWLTGCQVKINEETSGLSEFSYADVENYSVGAAELSETVEHSRSTGWSGM